MKKKNSVGQGEFFEDGIVTEIFLIVAKYNKMDEKMLPMPMRRVPDTWLDWPPMEPQDQPTDDSEESSSTTKPTVATWLTEDIVRSAMERKQAALQAINAATFAHHSTNTSAATYSETTITTTDAAAAEAAAVEEIQPSSHVFSFFSDLARRQGSPTRRRFSLTSFFTAGSMSSPTPTVPEIKSSSQSPVRNSQSASSLSKVLSSSPRRSSLDPSLDTQYAAAVSRDAELMKAVKDIQMDAKKGLKDVLKQLDADEWQFVAR